MSSDRLDTMTEPMTDTTETEKRSKPTPADDSDVNDVTLADRKVSQAALARIFNASTGLISGLVKRKILPRGGGLGEWCRAFLAYKTDVALSSNGPASDGPNELRKERTRLVRVQRQLAEVQLEAARREAARVDPDRIAERTESDPIELARHVLFILRESGMRVLVLDADVADADLPALAGTILRLKPEQSQRLADELRRLRAEGTPLLPAPPATPSKGEVIDPPPKRDYAAELPQMAREAQLEHLREHHASRDEMGLAPRRPKVVTHR